MRAGSEGRDLTAAVLFSHGFLASLLTAGLRGLGWEIDNEPPNSPAGRVVIAVEDDGTRGLRGSGLRTARQLILVGGLRHLEGLTSGAVLLRASAAVNADLPYDEVVRLTDAALRAGPASERARSHLHARLSSRRAEAGRFDLLTDREADVLGQLSCGRSAVEIAQLRPVSLATVRSQIAAILRKLEVPSQSAAVALTNRACRDHRVLSAVHFHQNY